MNHLTRHIPYNHHRTLSIHPIFHTPWYLTLSILIQSPYSALLNKLSCGDVGGAPSEAEKSSTALAPGLSQRLSQTCDPHLKAMDSSPDAVCRGLYSEQDRYTRYGAVTAES